MQQLHVHQVAGIKLNILTSWHKHVIKEKTIKAINRICTKQIFLTMCIVREQEGIYVSTSNIFQEIPWH